MEKHIIVCSTCKGEGVFDINKNLDPTPNIRVKKDALKQESVGAAEPRKVDWTEFDALTDADIEASIRDDPDVAPELDDDWFASATLVLPEQIIIDCPECGGGGYFIETITRIRILKSERSVYKIIYLEGFK